MVFCRECKQQVEDCVHRPSRFIGMGAQVVEQFRAKDVGRGRASVFDGGANALERPVLPVVEHDATAKRKLGFAFVRNTSERGVCENVRF
jgi:hypothetical protein